MSYYTAKFAVLRKTSKYTVIFHHFENIPVNGVFFYYTKDSDETCTFTLKCENIDQLNSALEWIEETTGLEPYESSWIEKD